MTVMLEPLRGNLWDGVVCLRWALWHSSQAGCGSLAHGGKHGVVDVLLQIGGLLYKCNVCGALTSDDSVFNSQ